MGAIRAARTRMPARSMTERRHWKLARPDVVVELLQYFVGYGQLVAVGLPIIDALRFPKPSYNSLE
jgi:hypothetical protein